MKFQRMLRAFSAMLLFLFLVSAFAEGSGLIGEWVYPNDPEVTVLTLKEDGFAFFGGQELTWQDKGDELLLTDGADASFRLVYAPSESGMTFWLPARYTRISQIGFDGEIVGTWAAEGESLSSFVFTEDGRFLEDGVFTGSFVQDSERGRITLKYLQGLFEDTVILYSFDGSALVISYPWILSRK